MKCYKSVVYCFALLCIFTPCACTLMVCVEGFSQLWTIICLCVRKSKRYSQGEMRSLFAM